MGNIDNDILEFYIAIRDVSFVFCLILAILSFLSAKINIKKTGKSGSFAFIASGASSILYHSSSFALLTTNGISIFPNPAMQLIFMVLFVCNTVFCWRNP